MIRALEDIEAFGYANPGHGFTCARMASVALGKEPRAADKWNRVLESADATLSLDDIEADGFITLYYTGQPTN